MRRRGRPPARIRLQRRLGRGDFLGGLKSRQLPLLNVLVARSPPASSDRAYVAIRGEGPPGGHLAVGAALRPRRRVGLAAFYRGLAVGNMGVVAPISSTAAVVPLVVGVAGGDRPGGVQYAGIALALVGVALASREEVGAGRGGAARGAGLALLSRLGFGLFFVGWTRPATRTWRGRSSSTAPSVGAAGRLRGARPRSPRAGRPARPGADRTLDIAANAMFAVASTKGLVSLVSVLGSLYPSRRWRWPRWCWRAPHRSRRWESSWRSGWR